VCIEGLYSISKIEQKPDLVVIMNPGFPLPSRRSWDASIQELLKAEALVLVTAEGMIDALPTDQRYADTPPYSQLHIAPEREDFPMLSEVNQVYQTLHAYGARFHWVHRNPFTYEYLDPGDQMNLPAKADSRIIKMLGSSGVIIKNLALTLFQGRQKGSLPITTVPMDAETQTFALDESTLKELFGGGAVKRIKAYRSWTRKAPAEPAAEADDQDGDDGEDDSADIALAVSDAYHVSTASWVQSAIGIYLQEATKSKNFYGLAEKTPKKATLKRMEWLLQDIRKKGVSLSMKDWKFICKQINC